jgi:hypothetical protein
MLERGKRREEVGVGAKGWEINTHMLRYLLKNVDNSSEGKIILNSNFILKNMKCSIHKNSALLYERHKHIPKTDTVIITNVTAVTSGKHSDFDTETAIFERPRNLYIT